MREKINRREFLKEAGSIAGSVAGAIILGRDTETSQSSEAQRHPVIPELKSETDDVPRPTENVGQYTDRLLREFSNLETRELPHGRVSPEWERTGDRMLVIMTFATPEVTEQFINRCTPLFMSIPKGTTLHIVTTAELNLFIQNAIKTRAPDLQFETHPLPVQGMDSIIYAQDVTFSTGGVDPHGAAYLLTSTSDRLLRRQGEHISPEELQRDQIQFDLDKKLAKVFPEVFKAIDTPVGCEGGDIEVSQLPNGKRVLFLGTASVFKQAIFMAVGILRKEGSYKEGLFRAVLEKITMAYQKIIDVDEVVVIDKEELVAWGEGVLQKTVKKTFDRSIFFHIDMVFKTGMNAEGVPIAFFTQPTNNTHFVGSDHTAYLGRVRKQLVSLGYKVIELPCGSYATRNYTNMLMFHPRGGKPTVMLPQYDEQTDAEAVRIIKEQGFHVIPVDMSLFFNAAERQDDIGSLHCLTETLT